MMAPPRAFDVIVERDWIDYSAPPTELRANSMRATSFYKAALLASGSPRPAPAWLKCSVPLVLLGVNS
jgi:hypothetical protein